jgi:hypothetical protein
VTKKTEKLIDLINAEISMYQARLDVFESVGRGFETYKAQALGSLIGMERAKELLRNVG